ncbi:hypothetical protein ACN28S_35635 [Cystobacter fuscus]
MALPALQLGRDRDAWATIRGFVYQVALTLERWLDLADDEHLELERGEDIDTVAKVLAASGVEESTRLLEQIKYREKNVTLRSSAVIEFLAAVAEHKEKNPGQILRFRFLTTVDAGTEKPSPFTPRYPALAHWATVVNKGQFDVDTVNKILTLVREAERPEGLAENTWKQFKAFLSGTSAAAFFEFMKLIEWSFNTGDLNALGADIRAKIVQRKLAATEEESQDFYQRLFFHIFHLLSERGLKTLTKIELSNVLKRPPLAPQYQALFAQVTGHLAVLENRFETVEQGLTTVQHGLLDVEETLATHRAELQRIVTSQGLPTTITLGPSTFVYVSPPLVQGIIRRTELVKSLQADLDIASILVLSGQASIGKTQLARLLIEPEKTLWLALRHKKPEESVALFETAQSVAHANHKTHIVLDDLPRLSSGDQLTTHMLHLASSAPQKVKLIATISAPLPLTLKEDTPTGFLIERPVPLLQPDEIRELLLAHKAPENILEPTAIQVVQEATTGHPMLVRALIRYLQKQGWLLTTETLQAVAQKEFAKDVQKETQQLLLRTVEGDKPRELLYRLDLVVEPIRERHLQIVSAVIPVIPAPFEQLDELRGFWIQDTAADRYSLSPLLEGLGTKNLPEDVQRNIHQSLGNDITSRRPLSIFEADTAIYYFTKGQLHDRAGLLYLFAMTNALKIPTRIRRLSLSRRWINNDLPNGMSRSVKLYVRGVQVRVLDALHEDTTYTLRQLDALLGEATSTDTLAVIHASLNAGPLRTEVSASLSEKYYRQAVAAAQNAVETNAEQLPEDFLTGLYGMIWINSARVETIDDLREWLKTVQQIGETGRQSALQINTPSIRDESSLLLPQRFALEEYKKPAESRNWLAVLAAQEDLEREAQKLNLIELAGFSVAAQLMVIYDSSQDISRVTKVATEALKRYGAMPRVRFAIQSNFGRQLGHAGKIDEGLAELKSAISIDTGSFAIVNRLHGYIEAARLAAQTADAEEAINFANKAVQFSTVHPELSFERIKALGELSILLSDLNGIKAGYKAWAKTAEEILLAQEDTPHWKALFSIIGHSIGYYHSIATTGLPPSTIDGGQPYVKPLPGIFLRYSEAAATIFDSNKTALICAQLAMYADSIGDDQEARRWAEHGIQIAEKSGSESTRALLANLALPYLLITNAFATAITGSVSAATTLLRESRHGLNKELHSSDEQLLRKDGEAMGRYQSFFPVFVRLLHMNYQGDPLAKTAAQEVIGVCQQLSKQSTQPKPWELAASIIDATFVRGALKSEFDLLLEEAEQTQENLLKAITLFGASFAPDVSVKQTLANHITALNYAMETLKLKGSTMRLIVHPFMRDFWQWRFSSAKFQFRSPNMVEKELAQASQLSGPDGVRAILLSLSYGLALNLPNHFIQWLTIRSTDKNS